ncbi:MAG: hypothetical protein ACTSR7_05850 [Promethearchaeota archaeon]
MEKKENIAQEAIRFLDAAQIYEENGDLTNAIENYLTAAELLKQSGYMSLRINDIYDRVDRLKENLKNERLIQQVQLKAQLESLQEQAFSLLDAANKFEKNGQYDNAIEQYNSAINLLFQAGWSDIQLDNLRNKLHVLTEKIKNRQIQITPETSRPQIVGAFGQKKDDIKAEELLRFKDAKAKEEQIQNDAFSFIDNAKFYETDRKYDKAILNYQNAIALLNSIGWQEQTIKLQMIIEKLKQDKATLEAYQKSKSTKVPSESNLIAKRKEQAYEDSAKKLEVKKLNEDKIQSDAFTLIDIGKRMEREKHYDKAIENYQQAIDMFKLIDWDSYIQPIKNFIKDIKEKQDLEKSAKKIKKKRELEIEKIQETIYSKVREDLQKTNKELEERRLKYESQRRQEERQEQEFLKILENADDILQNKREFDKAILKYQQALDFLEKLGKEWESYKGIIKSTIENVKILKEQQFKKEFEESKRQDEKKESHLVFQQQISDLLDRERNRIKKQEIVMLSKNEELKIYEKRKNDAFVILENAQNYIREGDLEKAILAYTRTINIFAEIHWIDEIPLIEDSIKELEMKKKDEIKLKQEERQKSLNRLQKEQEFQEQISKQLEIERKKLKQQDIKMRERANELEYREKRKEEAFQLMDEAQIQLMQGNFDSANEIYNSIVNIFADIQWYDEIELIQNSILEIEQKKRKVQEKKEKELRNKLEKERSEREFQAQLIAQMRRQQENLKKQDITIREHEKELEYREKRKNEAFTLINKAQDLISLTKYDEAIELYHEVAKIFAQIQWREELPLINQAIREIGSKKAEKEAWKQKTIEEGIKRETAYKRFIDQVKRQREVEKIKIQKEIEQLEKKKVLSVQNLKKQDNALKLIETADDLIKQENYQEAISNYTQSIKALEEIGWTGGYLKLLKETLDSIYTRKVEKEKEKVRKEQLIQGGKREEEIFKKKIREKMEREQKRLRMKQIEVQKQEDAKARMELQRIKAFKLLDNAEVLLNKGDYNLSIQTYRQAGLILSEIDFPTDVVKVMIHKIQVKKREGEQLKQKELENKIKLEEENRLFQEKMQKLMSNEAKKIRLRQIKVKQDEERKIYLEQKKEEAFDILAKAEIIVSRGNYDEAFEIYRKAELILNEIQFPTDLIKETRIILREKRFQEDLRKQKGMERQLQKEREETIFQKKLSIQMREERERLNQKSLLLTKKEALSREHEEQRILAFSLLDKAQVKVMNGDFDGGITDYQKVESIFKVIGWKDELPLVMQSISDLKLRKKEQQRSKQKLEEAKIKRDKEDIEFQNSLIQQLHQEKKKLRDKEIAIRKHKEELQFREHRKDQAFNLMDTANNLVDQGNFDEAIEIYLQIEEIFAEIQWLDELELIRSSIIEIRMKKQKAHMNKQQELQEKLKKEREEFEFQRQITNQNIAEQEKLQKREIKIKERDKELKIKEAQREEAFKLLDQTQELISQKKYEDAIELYHAVADKFARIGWLEETPFIYNAIQDAENKNKELKIIQQRKVIGALEKEKENQEFIQSIKLQRQYEDIKLNQEREKIDQLKQIKIKGKQNETIALKLIEDADDLLKNESFNKAIAKYVEAINILSEIGWEGSYLTILKESVQYAKQKKQEFENRKEMERKKTIKEIEEQKSFERELKEQMERERERLQAKQFEIKKREETIKLMNERKDDAFKIMAIAQNLLDKGQYKQSIEKYYQAELVLSEISYPTDVIRETIQQIQIKMQEDNLLKQQDFERFLKKEEEEKSFQLKIAESLKQEKAKLKMKTIQLKQRDEQRRLMENRKEQAFNLLDNAEIFMKNGNYDKSIEFYRSAELILNELRFPTDYISQMIIKVSDMQKRKDLEKQQALEKQLQNQRDEIIYQQKISEDMFREKKRLENKRIKVMEKSQLAAISGKKKDEAFTILDLAKELMQKKKFDDAIKAYRNAMIILNEIQYPTEALNETINKILTMKKQQEQEEEFEYQRRVEAIQEKRRFQLVLEERKRQGREQTAARELAFKERERLVQEQITNREVAYSLLEEAGKYLKKQVPDYDNAISLYIQSRNILAEKIGWEPEINNLNNLIRDLETEKAGYLERKKQEEQLNIKRQREYELFQEEVRKRNLEYENQKKEQDKKLRELYISRKRADKIKEEGLAMIDKGREKSLENDYKSAYEVFELAIKKFKQIGWQDEVAYIQKEIDNTRLMEKRFEEEKIKAQKIHEVLLKRKRREKARVEKREKELSQTVSEVSNFASEITNIIKSKRKELNLLEEQRKEQIKNEAKGYRKSLTEIIKLKKDLIDEITQSEEKIKVKEDKIQFTKDKEEADEIKRMLKDIKKKKK